MVCVPVSSQVQGPAVLLLEWRGAVCAVNSFLMLWLSRRDERRWIGRFLAQAAALLSESVHYKGWFASHRRKQHAGEMLLVPFVMSLQFNPISMGRADGEKASAHTETHQVSQLVSDLYWRERERSYTVSLALIAFSPPPRSLNFSVWCQNLFVINLYQPILPRAAIKFAKMACV